MNAHGSFGRLDDVKMPMLQASTQMYIHTRAHRGGQDVRRQDKRHALFGLIGLPARKGEKQRDERNR